MTAITKQYQCAHCPDAFGHVKLGGHVHANHPEHKRRPPKYLRTAAPERPARPSLKRTTDTWPGRP